jgi:starch synthase
MNILLASSEVHPYSKSGGLADMVGALGKFLARDGHHVSVVTPLYSNIRERFPEIKPFDWKLDLPVGDQSVQGNVYARTFEDRLTIYFIDQKHFYQRTALYSDKGVDYPDNAERFAFFSKAVVNLARYLPSPPDVVHVHDWQAALVPLLMLNQKWHEGWHNAPPTCLTIHNLAFQGIFAREKYPVTNLSLDFFNQHGAECYGMFNFLKAGISYADLITTVSPRYAREITTEQFGCGLDGALRQRQNALVGVLNGVDYDEWQTEENNYLDRPYNWKDLSGKEADKLALQKEMGLPVDPNIPLFGTVTRLAEQKGVDIQLGALEEMLAANLQFVLLGSGSKEYEHAYAKLAARYPKKCAVKIGFDQGLSHRIEAGSDFFVMPSRFEPCGLNQMYSLRYGTIPIVRVTGGLDDSVTDISENDDKADGIKFTEYSVRSLAKAIRKALIIYEDKELLQHYRLNGMKKDFSWDRTAKAYEKVYQRIVPSKEPVLV